jgi:hypothetical protein
LLSIVTCGPKGPRAFRGAKVRVSIYGYTKIAKKFYSWAKRVQAEKTSKLRLNMNQ